MGFYNRPQAQPVQKFVDLLGKVEPLNVVEYGGLASITASILSGGTTTILPGASAGFAYRLHAWGVSLAAAVGSGGASIQDSASPLDVFMTGSVNGLSGLGRPLAGQLTTAPVACSNFLGNTLTFWIRYDLVITPTIL